MYWFIGNLIIDAALAGWAVSLVLWHRSLKKLYEHLCEWHEIQDVQADYFQAYTRMAAEIISDIASEPGGMS